MATSACFHTESIDYLPSSCYKYDMKFHNKWCMIESDSMGSHAVNFIQMEVFYHLLLAVLTDNVMVTMFTAGYGRLEGNGRRPDTADLRVKGLSGNSRE